MAELRRHMAIGTDLIRAIARRLGLRARTETAAPARRRLADRPMSRAEALAMRGARAIAAAPTETPPV
ncbi:MAG: type II toxin-antitoxin system VapB family antitoxin [Actinomycetota bacterium]|nr:type II toxin-antitoxin system VapB family antitoxin [Actinomycetota bacterium]